MRFLISFLLLITTLTIAAQPGTLDNSFGNGGKLIENTSAPYVEIVDAVMQTDGKIMVLANAEYNHKIQAVLVRYNTNGTLDNTFSGDGIADSPLTGTGDEVYPLAIKLQADGKILICGHSYNAPFGAFVARYHADGSLDNSFGGIGIVYIQDDEIYEINNLMVLPNGQLVLLGTKPNFLPGAGELALIKLNTDGSLNGSFGTAGIATVDAVENASPTYSKIELQSDGKFIVGGTRSADGFSNDDSVLVVRINADGTIDHTYATNGVLSFDPGPAGYHQFSDMAIQPDGKIIVSGYGSTESNFNYSHITRININGTKDNGFGMNGVLYLHSASTGFGSTGQISLQADGKVLVAGFAKNASGNYAISVARLTTAGMLDAGFDGDGIALLQVNNYGSYGIAPLQQADGKIVLAGFAGNGDAFSTTIGRFTATGQTDNTINAGSTAIAYIGSGTSYEEGQNILVQPDQKIIAIRSRSNGFSYNIGLSRHFTNGILDNSFGVNGRTVIDLPGYSNNTFSSLLSNGKIMAVSDVEDVVAGRRIGLLRFNTNGFPDSSFGTNGKLFFITNSNEFNRIIDAVVQPDGKTVILVSQFIDSYQMIDTTLLIRLNADGSYDNTFNGNGKIVLPSFGYPGYKKVLVQNDGKILLEHITVIGNTFHTLIKRLNANGGDDITFNAGNYVEIPLEVAVTTLQPDGKILLAEQENKLVRLNSNGSFDATFDGDGKAEPAYSFEAYEGLTDIEIQTDGKILLSGSGYDTDYNERFQVVRLLANGSLDTGFGTGGITTVPTLGNIDNYDYSKAMALQADGKILLTGYSEYYDLYYSDFAMVRLNNSNVGPTYTFTGNGNWDVATNWNNNSIPPATLPAGSIIFIDPVAGGECVLTVTQHVSAGASFTVKAGKKFRVMGNLILQ